MKSKLKARIFLFVLRIFAGAEVFMKCPMSMVLINGTEIKPGEKQTGNVLSLFECFHELDRMDLHQFIKFTLCEY